VVGELTNKRSPSRRGAATVMAGRSGSPSGKVCVSTYQVQSDSLKEFVDEEAASAGMIKPEEVIVGLVDHAQKQKAKGMLKEIVRQSIARGKRQSSRPTISIASDDRDANRRTYLILADPRASAKILICHQVRLCCATAARE